MYCVTYCCSQQPEDSEIESCEFQGLSRYASCVPGNNRKVQPEYSGFFYLRRDSEIDSVS